MREISENNIIAFKFDSFIWHNLSLMVTSLPHIYNFVSKLNTFYYYSLIIIFKLKIYSNLISH